MPTSGTTTLNTPWSRIANSTIRDFIREEEPNIFRNRKFTALMKKRGRITYNHSGVAMDWKVRYRRAPMVGFADGDTITFSRQDRHKTAAVDWRGYSASDALTKLEFLQNRSTEAIIKLFESRSQMLLSDVEDQFGDQMYIDGTAVANAKLFHGIETFMTGTVSQATANGNVTPTAVYGGLSCVPGNFGGSWAASGSLTWPNGKGDVVYDFWSPLIVDCGSAFFNSSGTNLWGSSATAANNVAVEAVSYAIIKSKKSPSKKGELDVFMLSDEGYRQYVSLLRSLQRIVVNGQTSELIGLGFDDVVQQDGGKDITWEWGLPTASSLANTKGVIGYGLNLDQVELCSLQSEVWVPEGPSFDDATKTWRWSIDCFGNLKWNPKYQVKIMNNTTTDSASA